MFCFNIHYVLLHEYYVEVWSGDETTRLDRTVPSIVLSIEQDNTEVSLMSSGRYACELVCKLVACRSLITYGVIGLGG